MNTCLQFKGFLNTPTLFLKENNLLNYPFFQISTIEIEKNNIPFVKENLMLGKRVESFFKHYLTIQNTFEILVENLQIFHDKRTIGEIDFILKNNETAEKLHIELTYKFYLFDPNNSEEEAKNWIGPNRNDSLVEKISKLKEKQFPLLQSNFINNPIIKQHRKSIKQQVCFQGQLFIPFSYKDYIFENINPNAIKGYYIKHTELTKNHTSEFLFFIPKKQDWLIDPIHNIAWFSFEEISQTLNESIIKKKSPLVWTKDKNNQVASLFITWW